MDIPQIGELVAIILIVCGVAKAIGLNSKFIPLLALILGGAGAYVFFHGTGFLDSLYSVLTGIATGLGTTLTYREVASSLS